MDELLTVKQVAELLQLHEMTIRRYIKNGKLEAVRIGRNVRVPRRAVEAFLHAENPALREAPPIYRAGDAPPSVESTTSHRLQHLRRQIEQLKRERADIASETLWEDLEQTLDQILQEALTTGTAVEGEWQGD